MKWLTRFAWLVIAADLVFLFFACEVRSENQMVLLAWAVGLILSLLAASTWLIIAYRRIFHHWYCWIMPPLLFIISSYVTQGAIPISYTPLSFFFTLLGIVSLWAVGLTTAIFLWRNDDGLKILAWSSVGTVWLVALAWRLHGNLIELSFTMLSLPDELSPLWWIYPLFPLMIWLIPLTLLSIAGHTIRLIHQEIQPSIFSLTEMGDKTQDNTMCNFG